MLGKSDVKVVQYDYDEVSIRIWFTNHEVHEYTLDLVGAIVFNQMINLADAGRGLDGYLQSAALKAFQPRKWKEWLYC